MTTVLVDNTLGDDNSFFSGTHLFLGTSLTTSGWQGVGWGEPRLIGTLLGLGILLLGHLYAASCV